MRIKHLILLVGIWFLLGVYGHRRLPIFDFSLNKLCYTSSSTYSRRIPYYHSDQHNGDLINNVAEHFCAGIIIYPIQLLCVVAMFCCNIVYNLLTSIIVKFKQNKPLTSCIKRLTNNN